MEDFMAKKAPKPIPDWMNTVTAHIWFNGNCKEAVDYYKKVFSAQLLAPPIETPDKKGILHVMLKIGDTNIMMADAIPGQWEKGPELSTTIGFWLYVEDCDDQYNKAVNAGCEIINEMMDAFWGDRMGKVKDPFGHCWAIASQKWLYTDEEIQKNQEEWLKSLGM